MAFDVIVFAQEELMKALGAGNISIGLCDNEFTLPKTDGVRYTAIGEVSVKTDMTAEELKRRSIVCDGFTPKVRKKTVSPAVKAVNNLPLPQSGGSYSSFVSSYFMSSYFMTSYIYEYEYEYEVTSYSSSYSASYVSSFRSSLSSYASTSYAAGFLSEKSGVCVLVNGYGINLI